MHATTKQIGKFGIVGILATLTHATALTILVEIFSLIAWQANGAAFLIALVVTYIGQSYWVFQDTNHTATKSTKFIMVALLGFFLNITIMYAMNELLALHYLIGFFTATLIIPIITFIFNKFWVFRP